MARGFESKDVEFQQAEAERQKTFGRALTSEEREREGRRKTLELALTRARADRDAARSDAHRRMLDAAVASLEADLRNIER
jgi:hypothetical protein